MPLRKRTFDLALEYVDKHLYRRCLFPVKPGAKFPPLIRDNLAQASSDPAQLAKWEKKWPGCNWGLSHKKSNVMVADVDTNPKKNKQGQKTYDRLDLIEGWPDTEKTTTPSGGFHKIYECLPGQPHIMAIGLNGIGKDIDSPNYTLIPGCTFDDGTSYVGNDVSAVDCPQWIYDTIKNSKAKARLPDAGEIVVELDLESNVAWAIDHLQNDAEPAIEGSGGEYITLKTAMTLKDNGISPERTLELMLEYYNPRCEPIWERADLEKKVANAFNYGSLSKVGGATAEAEFGDDPLPPEPPLSKAAKKEAKARVKAQAIEATRPIDPERAKKHDQLIKQWVWVVGMKRFINTTDPINNDPRDIWDMKQFDSEFNPIYFPAPKKGSASDFLLRLRKGSIEKFYRVAFKPEQPQVLINGQTFNMYRKSDIEPAEGDISWWNEHLEYLLPEQEYRDHLLNWMAWLLQNLKKKPKHALILQGEVNGTGKSFIAQVLKRILHPANVKHVPQNGLSGRFNSWALQCKLIIVEELRASDKRAVKEALHDIITEDVISVECKNIDPINVESCFGVFALTNDFAALELDNTDRRYLVLRTDRTLAEQKEKEAEGYFIRLFAKLEDPTAMAAVMYSLINRDLKGYNAQSSAPMTAAKAEMKEASRSALEQYLVDTLDQLPKLLRVQEDIIENLPRNLANKDTRIIRPFLKSRGAFDLGQCPMPSGERLHLWAVGPQAVMLSKLKPKEQGRLYAQDRDKVKKGPSADDASEEFDQE
jgi:hypothetical protein